VPDVLVKLRQYFTEHQGPLQEGVFRYKASAIVFSFSLANQRHRVAPEEGEMRAVKQQLNSNRPIQCRDLNCIPALIKVCLSPWCATADIR
jgi:hypothetical protein